VAGSFGLTRDRIFGDVHLDRSRHIRFACSVTKRKGSAVGNARTAPVNQPAGVDASTGLVTDQRGRQLRDLRISVTDRCNFRCVYCMPKQIFGRDFVFMERDELLTFEEMTRIARIAVAHGVQKIRLTGGEPLLRRGLEELVAMLAALRTPDGKEIDIALTTNGLS